MALMEFISGNDIGFDPIIRGSLIAPHAGDIGVTTIAIGQTAEEIRGDQAVIIRKGDNFPCGSLDSPVKSGCHPLTRLLTNVTDLRKFLGHHFSRSISGAVVHHDDLVIMIVLSNGCPETPV